MNRKYASLTGLACSAMLLFAQQSVADDLKPFTASYNVVWKGMNAGRSSLALTRKSDGHWLYESRNVARGLFRVALPGDITQTSEFRVVNDAIQPLSYVGDDGTSATKRDVNVAFDWQAKRVTGVYEDAKIDMAVEPGVVDDLTVQVALMHELMRGRTPSSFRLLDKDQIKDYEYTREGTATIDTAIGRKEATIYRSRRPGSKHSTMFWCAADSGYIPLKVERRDGKDGVEWSMSVQTLKRD